jgi:hypothetical protein
MARGRAAVVAVLCALTVGAATAGPTAATTADTCGIPDTGTVWVDYARTHAPSSPGRA